jgi:hypothetical protein
MKHSRIAFGRHDRIKLWKQCFCDGLLRNKQQHCPVYWSILTREKHMNRALRHLELPRTPKYHTLFPQLQQNSEKGPFANRIRLLVDPHASKLVTIITSQRSHMNDARVFWSRPPTNHIQDHISGFQSFHHVVLKALFENADVVRQCRSKISAYKVVYFDPARWLWLLEVSRDSRPWTEYGMNSKPSLHPSGNWALITSPSRTKDM